MGEKSRIMVTGATSPVGAYLLPMLLAADHAVTGLSRQERPENIEARIEWHQTDITASPSLEGPPGKADILVHLAPLLYLPKFLTVCASIGITRIIAFSSTSVITKAGSGVGKEKALATALASAETELENQCIDLRIAWTVFRPTMIYGGNEASIVGFIERHIRRFGFFPIAGAGRGMRQPVHAEDLARACLMALGQQKTFGRIYNLAGRETLSFREMVERIFRQAGRRPRLLTIPSPVFAAGLAVLGVVPRYRELTSGMVTRMNEDLCFDVSDAAQDFGYTARDFLS